MNMRLPAFVLFVYLKLKFIAAFFCLYSAIALHFFIWTLDYIEAVELRLIVLVLSVATGFLFKDPTVQRTKRIPKGVTIRKPQ